MSQSDTTYESIDEPSEYEYRVSGCGSGQWKLTEWTDRETAVQDYQEASRTWDMFGFERRQPGDNDTIQRKQSPESEGWMDITGEHMKLVNDMGQ